LQVVRVVQMRGPIVETHPCIVQVPILQILGYIYL
jgi:hypothetical protein